ncbi:MAG TPA: WecB/TagA/CpsF family glycosyltransferase [Steroidobacteraceae bacterium]|nr:WecB/TagA/CpsF family glycosyltransferase [Steroidobacteraceae bacterium]
MTDNLARVQSANYSLAPSLPLPASTEAPTATVYAPINRVGDAKPGSREVVHVVDDLDLEDFTAVAAHYGQNRYGYVVTPNVDHFIRCHEDPSFRSLYRNADYVLMDSRFFARVLRLLTGVRLRVCTGSDLSETLLSRVVSPADRIVMVGGSEQQAKDLAAIYGLTQVAHHNPPMGFIKDPVAVEECLQFIEQASPFRFCFLAFGSPQQEVIANMLLARGKARGLALCVGASLNFVTGVEKRAPVWLQRLSLEWLHRLMQNPRRMAGRYLVRGPRIFKYLRRARFVLRKAPANA